MMLSQIPPVGNRIPVALSEPANFGSEFLKVFSIDGFQSHFYGSGTQALAALLVGLKNTAVEKNEVLIPAYCCPDVVSAVLYADLKPVLVDFEPERPFLSIDELSEKVSNQTLAVIGINFLGIQERFDAIRAMLDKKDIYIIEDSAQRSPWRHQEPFKGDCCIVSFGRGKPESVLEGGAAFLNSQIENRVNMPVGVVVDSSVANIKYRLKVFLYNKLLSPFFYGVVSRMPFLHVGQTLYKPTNSILSMRQQAKYMLLAKLRHQNRQTAPDKIRTKLKTYRESRLVDLFVASGEEHIAPVIRYPVLLPSKEAKLAFVEMTRSLGVSSLYPAILPDIEMIPSTITHGQYSNAQDFCDRLATLPCHEGVGDEIIKAIFGALDAILH